jgi:NAD(P)-dependent dehydrogenase (short-subunit alcohol dehydrogenase family)
MPTDLFALAGRHALVTGGARGLGRMCAEALLRHGATVTISARDPEAAEHAAREMRTIGECDFVAADLSDEDGVRALGRAMAQRIEALDILVNNAGVSWGAPLESHPGHAWAKVLQLDVVAPFQVVQSTLPLLEAAGRARRPARIINVGSIDGHAVGAYDNFSYACAKAALHQQTRVLAVALGPRAITVNCVAPAPVPTRMTQALLETERERLVAATPLRALPDQDDVAGALVFLSARAGAHVTGAVIPVDGGMAINTWGETRT